MQYPFVIVDGYFPLPSFFQTLVLSYVDQVEIFLPSTIVMIPFRCSLSLVEVHLQDGSLRSEDLVPIFNTRGLLPRACFHCQSYYSKTERCKCLLSSPLALCNSCSFPGLPSYQVPMGSSYCPLPVISLGSTLCSQQDASTSGTWADTILALGSRPPRYPHASPSSSGILGSKALSPHLCLSFWLPSATPWPPDLSLT